MWNWFVQLDRILRGDATRLSALERGSVEVPVFGLTFVIVLLGMIYGACMGTFALLRPDRPEYMQMFASAVKTPVLFLLTLVITFPSLYVFNALVGSRLFPLAVLRLVIASLGVNLAVLASLGPIVAFFSVTTTSYLFIVLLNVLVFAVSGVLGLSFLLQTLHRLTLTQQPLPRQRPALHSQPKPGILSEPPLAPVAAVTDPSVVQPVVPPAAHPDTGGAGAETEQDPSMTTAAIGALERLEHAAINAQVRSIFRCWIFVFGVVGAQVSWLMRPFIGNPNQSFSWFRPRESNFFQAVSEALWNLFV